MFTRRSTKTVIALSVIAVAMTAVSLPARAGEGGAIAAGVAGGVAGTMAGEVLSGALPPQNYYGPGYPAAAAAMPLRTPAGIQPLLLPHRRRASLRLTPLRGLTPPA